MDPKLEHFLQYKNVTCITPNLAEALGGMHRVKLEEKNKYGQGTISNLTKDDIKAWATELGLNAAEFNSCFDSGKYSSAVQANFSEGSQLGVSGTPSFFIGTSNGTGQKIVGAQPYSVFKQAIDALLQ